VLQSTLKVASHCGSYIRRTCANAGYGIKKYLTLKACYGSRRRARARFFKQSPIFAHVRRP